MIFQIQHFKQQCFYYQRSCTKYLVVLPLHMNIKHPTATGLCRSFSDLCTEHARAPNIWFVFAPTVSIKQALARIIRPDKMPLLFVDYSFSGCFGTCGVFDVNACLTIVPRYSCSFNANPKRFYSWWSLSVLQ